MKHLFKQIFYHVLCHKVSTDFKELKSSYQAIKQFFKNIFKNLCFKIKKHIFTYSLSVKEEITMVIGKYFGLKDRNATHQNL